MCGIAGFLHRNEREHDPEYWRGILTAFGNALKHRGPNSGGTWYEPTCGVGFAHQRLAILDLTQEGHQPMGSPSGRYVISYNGEIYNFRELRDDLIASGHQFRGGSDTEVILAAIERWGLQQTVARICGMFAFALWDYRQRELTLVRDRLGEKPLFYGVSAGTFVFGSELRILESARLPRPNIDRQSVAAFLASGNVPAPRTIYQGFSKLMPGTMARINYRESVRITVDEYWTLRDAIERGLASPKRVDTPDQVSTLGDLMRRAVSQQMISDVPIGALLSGGIDSSVVVALMQSVASRPVKTFCIGIKEQGYDEAGYAKDIARHLGTEHTELYVTPTEVLEVVKKMPSVYDEPFADPSQIPTFMVANLARGTVTVALSGDGGDELFCGYKRYFLVEKLWRNMAWIPWPMRATLANAITRLPVASLDLWFRWTRRVFAHYGRDGHPGDKLKKAATLLRAKNADDLYVRLTHTDFPSNLQEEDSDALLAVTAPGADFLENTLARMMYCDTLDYLPNDILVKVDRASMAVGLECRVPFLDHRIVEYAWSLPMALKYKGGVGKWILRELIAGYIPRTLFERPKMGFGLPIGVWLRGPLREWAEDLLAEDGIRRDGYMDSGFLRKRWTEHLDGTRNWQTLLWNALMFQAWKDAHVGR